MIIPFTPSNSSVPPFSVIMTLDNNQVQANVTWNLSGQRWYLTLTDQNADILWNGPLIGSPVDYDIYLAPGIFTVSTLVFREATNSFEVSP